MVKQRSRYMLAKNRRAGPKVLSPDATQKTAIAQAPVFTIITRRVNLKRSSRAKACVFTIFTRRVNRKLAQYARPNSQPDPHHAKPFAVGLFCVALITWQCSKCKPQTLPKNYLRLPCQKNITALTTASAHAVQQWQHLRDEVGTWQRTTQKNGLSFLGTKGEITMKTVSFRITD